MADKEWIDQHQYRVTSPDGRRRYLYHVTQGRETCIEVTETTRAERQAARL